ncbi:MAG: hypothetical protein U9Q22_01845 [Candidatus Altiarchaeota archaeon]|nr:hypothetical protein [Candidatus Altiarchaeota archaeon]
MHIDLRFRNLEAKRFSAAGSSINVHNNSSLKAVSKMNEKLSINFLFSCNYEPNIGLIRIEGDLLLSDSKENIERAITEWEDSGSKNLPPDIAEKVHNIILSNCIVEAVILSKEVQLPAPIPTPSVSLTKKVANNRSHEETKSYIR